MFLPELGKEIVSGLGEACAESNLGGRSSSSLVAVPFDMALGDPSGFLMFANVAAEGGRETCFRGVVSGFFFENQPDFFCFSSSRTTIRSSVKSGSYKLNQTSYSQ